MILVDANLLIYAIDRDSPHHQKAKHWLESTLSGTTEVGLAWIVILAFIRITTRHGIMRNPLPTEAAISYVESWLNQPYVTAVGPGQQHWPIFRNLLRGTGTAGNLTSDTHLAALALEHGYEIYSADYDFQRFPSITHINPLKD
jgi:toxin-antitoxin system PIN domain toxin